MGDLHSIAYFSDHLNLSCFSPDFSQCLYGVGMEINNTTPPPFYDELMMDSDHSSGYLEDALFEFRPKRRRLMMTHDDHHHQLSLQNSSPHSFPNYWDFNPTDQDFENFGAFTVSGENSSSSTQSKSSTNTSDKETLSSPDYVTGGIEERKKKVITRVVYPFALVKPGGFKGDMTLKDINERILMPPTRPLRHPVGDFACRPLTSLDRPGLSGKVVVALTRIQTHERGTITIIRTKN
ncbi:hypothetical protein SSX86_027810 [Deinandra increscens subsp. villosa]|uniref:Protein XRI1-like n=1 Tax=Deinandra increscens subsp. villosa TaxID=3103831 RepID=A0AAP0C6I4_9ASTR